MIPNGKSGVKASFLQEVDLKTFIKIFNYSHPIIAFVGGVCVCLHRLRCGWWNFATVALRNNGLISSCWASDRLSELHSIWMLPSISTKVHTIFSNVPTLTLFLFTHKQHSCSFHSVYRMMRRFTRGSGTVLVGFCTLSNKNKNTI